MASDDEYEAMEFAFRETARGRWFLDEHARRCRRPDVSSLLDALRRIERAVVPGSDPARDRASTDVDAAFERIGDAAERVREVSWSMREAGTSPDMCDRLDEAAREIQGASEIQGPREGDPRDGQATGRRDDNAGGSLARSVRAALAASAGPGADAAEPDHASSDGSPPLTLDDIDRMSLHEKLRLFT